MSLLHSLPLTRRCRGQELGLALGFTSFPIWDTCNCNRSPPRHDPAAGTWQTLLGKAGLPAMPPGDGDAGGNKPGAILCNGAKEGGNLAFLALYISDGAQSRGTDRGLCAEPVTRSP